MIQANNLLLLPVSSSLPKSANMSRPTPPAKIHPPQSQAQADSHRQDEHTHAQSHHPVQEHPLCPSGPPLATRATVAAVDHERNRSVLRTDVGLCWIARLCNLWCTTAYHSIRPHMPAIEGDVERVAHFRCCCCCCCCEVLQAGALSLGGMPAMLK
jgi:hypothetical protein